MIPPRCKVKELSEPLLAVKNKTRHPEIAAVTAAAVSLRSGTEPLTVGISRLSIPNTAANVKTGKRESPGALNSSRKRTG
jgi:hypothetical protein